MSPALIDSCRFLAALGDAGLPEGFSVAREPQIVPEDVLADIARFIRVFDRVTEREAWRTAALSEAPPIAKGRRREVCFFSAWDFHLPSEGVFQLIEFNDNGSGFLFASIINALFYEAAGLSREKTIVRPASISAFRRTIADLVEREAKAFFGERPVGLVLVMDDPQSLANGKFRGEHKLLCYLLAENGWQAAVGSPEQTRWDGERLTFENQPVALIVNRSTDFFWRSNAFAAVRAAFEKGGLYVAPNPFTYAVRSDKGLMEWLSSPNHDDLLRVAGEERRVLADHVPETHILRENNVDMLADRKAEFVFKPRRGFASRGVLDSGAVGRTRLRRLMKQGDGFVAQRRIAKAVLWAGDANLWTDLRVWAYRGDIILLSGRASRRPDRLDLSPPGGWLPAFSSK
jgi:hypothetical protein